MAPFAGAGCAQSDAVTYFNPAKTEAIENTSEDCRIVFRKLEIYGVASIPQGAFQDFHARRTDSLAASDRLAVSTPINLPSQLLRDTVRR
jgi:hypothetical protein